MDRQPRHPTVLAWFFLLLQLGTLTEAFAGDVMATAWLRRYDAPVRGNYYGNVVKVDGRGDVVIMGRTYDGSRYFIAKYAGNNGALLWERDPEGLAALVLDADGNVVVTGTFSNGTNNDLYTAKYAATDGTLLWKSTYNGPANGNDSGSKVFLDRWGNAIAAGVSSDGTNSDYYTAKYAAETGALLAETRYKSSTNTGNTVGLAVDTQGCLIVLKASEFDFYTAKYAGTNGLLLWENWDYGLSHTMNRPAYLALDKEGNAIVTGYSYGYMDWPYFYTAKYAASNGSRLWGVGGGSCAYPSRLAIDSSGNVVVTGTSGVTDCYTAKYAAADGALLWEHLFRGSSGDGNAGIAIALDSSDNVVIAGTTRQSRDEDYYTAKYASGDGALLWEQSFDGLAYDGGYHGDGCRDVAVDASGSIVVTGYSYDGTNNNCLTIKYILVRSPTLSVRPAGPDGVQVSFSGTPGVAYSLQRTESLTSPFTTVGKATIGTEGMVKFTDPSPAAAGAFYRAVYP